MSVVLVVGASGIVIGQRMMSTLPAAAPASPVSTVPSQSSATSEEIPALPIFMDDPPVVEATDLPTAVTLGQSWEVTDGDPSQEHLDAGFLVSPCGMLVTMLTTAVAERDSLPQDHRGLGSRIIGYDIATGTRLWSQDLRQITGQADPFLYADPTYTNDCRMVFTTVDATPQPSGLFIVNLVVDLSTGVWAILDTEDEVQCEAALNGWVGCWADEPEQEVWAVNVNDLSSPGWREASDPIAYSSRGDIVAAGRIWTPEGYRDPSTGTVDFGADTHIGENRTGTGTGTWVVYVEPHSPGGYRSGLVLRVDGPLDSGSGECHVMLWDTAADVGLWSTPGTTPCGGGSVSSWAVAGQALLITFRPDTLSIPIPTTRAYSLANGIFLWEREGMLASTPFDRVYSGAEKMTGVSQGCVFLLLNPGTDAISENIVRISDGADVAIPSFNMDIFSETMSYVLGAWPGEPFSLFAYQIDPLHPQIQPSVAWSVVISDEFQHIWTFATNGTMYVVHGNGSMSVTPLIA